MGPSCRTSGSMPYERQPRNGARHGANGHRCIGRHARPCPHREITLRIQFLFSANVAQRRDSLRRRHAISIFKLSCKINPCVPNLWRARLLMFVH
jgi:hypothetical protein